MSWEIREGDCREVMASMAASSVDAIVTDPPYGLSFMGKGWDHGVPGVEFWTEALRVAKPGAHLLAFGGTRTYHRLACAIEDAGWEIRDCVMWVYGSGFPKSLDVSKAIDRMDAREEQSARRYRFTAWVRSTGVTARQIDDVLGTHTMGRHYTDVPPNGKQPAIMTREHLEACRHLLGEVPEWVEREVDIRSVESKTFRQRKAVGGSRFVPDASVTRPHFAAIAGDGSASREYFDTAPVTEAARKWSGWGTALKPAWEPVIVARKPLAGAVDENLLEHGTGAINVDGCRVEGAAMKWESPRGGIWRTDGTASARMVQSDKGRWPGNLIHDGSDEATAPMGEAARYFYCAKASKADRGEGNNHPTVKPTDLMAYLCRLVTPPGGTVLDLFCGSGSTGKAAVREGFGFIGIEREAEYAELARRRIQAALEGQEPDLFG
jgi:DNA modification methylase